MKLLYCVEKLQCMCRIFAILSILACCGFVAGTMFHGGLCVVAVLGFLVARLCRGDVVLWKLTLASKRCQLQFKH